jgi:sugar phosphate isomerase/epimerase
MIYVSSSCVKHSKISESILALHQNGFSNIEFSGGTRPYPDLKQNILELKNTLNLNLMCHNYFPPPHKDFVLNLASLNHEIFDLSFNHVVNAIELSALIGAEKFAVHAGFLIDIPLHEVGKSIANQQLFDENLAKEKFYDAVKKLLVIANKNKVKLYIENNVVSSTNFKNFGNINPFFICQQKSIEELLTDIPGVNILIDVAHLKVSCNALQLNFKEELINSINFTDYIHLSDNDGLSDSNKEIKEDSELFELLKKCNLKNKTYTLEIYSGIEKVKETYNLINNLIYE